MQQTTPQRDTRHGEVEFGHISTLAQSFRRSLLTENKAPTTVAIYCDAVRLLAEFLERTGMPARVDAVRREHVESFVADLLTRNKPATAPKPLPGAQGVLSLARRRGGDSRVFDAEHEAADHPGDTRSGAL